MTLEQMQRRSKERMEAILGAWKEQPTGKTKELLNAYKQSYTEITADIKKVYGTTLSGIGPDDSAYYNAMLKYNRLDNLRASVKKSYTAAAKSAAKQQFAMSTESMTEIYYSNMYSTNWFSSGYFSLLDQKAVEVSVYGTSAIWQSIKEANRARYSPYLPQYGTLSQLLEDNAVRDLKKINEAITQGLIQGKPYAEVSRDLRKIYNTTGSNAIRIARTEGNRNLNAGAFANSQAASDSGIDLKRMYLATLDTRTRSQSGAMDGQKRDVDKPFNYGGFSWFIPGNSGNPAYDINDRCSVVDIVDNQNPELRRGRNPVTGQTEVADFGSFNDWMTGNNLTRNKSGMIVPVT